MRLLDMLRERIGLVRNEQLYSVKMGNIWGIFILLIIILISPLLIFLARNVISTFQVFATSLDMRARALKQQHKKQNKLIYRMLPQNVVDRLKGGEDVIETFSSATIYYSTVVCFQDISINCTAVQVTNLCLAMAKSC